ncbi:putative MFS family arabinose efflux permease [Actinoplanes lutulentus]|uniref:Putative MFS family arabinose efflux permease n=1 Tax=Actinoplanes lutulentus TaxID=1287878 RepID=A0A327ZG38_9ACTN|nr:MFS transporter [Actinoplanes lutulentus]RAK40076.1 putative MFS family arabinose efflux permease [Actinoplanes lutulentus]
MGRGGTVHRVYSVVVFVILAALDNVAIGIVPPLYGSIGDDLGVGEGHIALATTAMFLISAVAAIGFAYVGDRTDRKPVLVAGTTIWVIGTAWSGLAESYPAFLSAQVVAAFGLGGVASVSFAVVSDLISPRRRGLVMSFWGLSQGVGTLAGTLVGGLLGHADWRRPFLVTAAAGVIATCAYLLTYNVPRGDSQPELAGVEYDERIHHQDIPVILKRRTNVWLILQGGTAQIAFGSLVWLPILFRARAEDQGYSAGTAVLVGSIFATIFQLGAALSILGGLAGDRLQRRTPRGRALVASVGVLAAVPFYVVLFFVPMKITVPDGGSTGELIRAVLANVVTEPTVAACLAIAVFALMLTSANSPNWFAMIADVNPPQHRGTVYSLGNLINGVGRAGGNALVGVAFRGLAGAFPPPLNYAVGLAAFQFFFIPTGIMYWLASRTVAADMAETHTTLLAVAAERSDDGPDGDVGGDPAVGVQGLAGQQDPGAGR